MASRKVESFVVQQREVAVSEDDHVTHVTPRPRLITGTRAQVESYLIGGYSIDPCGVEKAVELGRDGVVIEDAKTK